MAVADILNALKKPPILATIGATLAGGLTNTAGSRTGNATTNNVATNAGSSTSMPATSPAYSTLGDLLRQRAQERLQGNLDMKGLEANGIMNINDAFGGAQTALDADLTSRGLAASPVAGTAASSLQAARGGNIAQWLNELPMIQRQMQNEDFAQAQGLFQLGQGQTNTNANTQATTGTQTQTEPGSAVGGALQQGGNMLSFLQGQGLFKDILKGAGGGTGDAPVPGGAPTQGGGSSLSGKIIELAKNPITIGVAAALGAGAVWLKSQAHWEANTAVKDFEEPFAKNTLAPFAAHWDQAIKSGQMTKQQGLDAYQQYAQNWNDYITKIHQWGQKGDKALAAEKSIKNLYDKVVRGQQERMTREIAGLA